MQKNFKIIVSALALSLCFSCTTPPQDASEKVKEAAEQVKSAVDSAQASTGTTTDSKDAKTEEKSETPASTSTDSSSTTTPAAATTTTTPAATTTTAPTTATDINEALKDAAAALPAGVTIPGVTTGTASGTCNVSVLSCAVAATPELKDSYQKFIDNPAEPGCAQAVAGAEFQYPQCK